MALEPSTGGALDFLQLHRGMVPPRARTDWLTGQLRDAILDRRLTSGAALPASRALAVELGLARGVVVEAYARLAAEGLLHARTGAGTAVSRAIHPTSAGGSASGPPIGAGPPSLRLPMRPPPGIEFDLSPGLPDLSAFPRRAWLSAERSVLARACAAELGYGDPRGAPPLREQLAGWLGRTRGLRASAEQIIVVNGVAQSLALSSHVLRRRGAGRLALEDPGSRGARDELSYWGWRLTGVAVDDHGIDVTALGAAEVDAVLVTPAHQFPTGIALAPQRRRALIAWAAQHRWIIEDDYDAEHRYDRAPVAALQASAPDRVIHTGSASKTLAPGLRLGWLVAPPSLLDELIEAKHASDIASGTLAQLVFAELIATGALARHVRATRGRHRARRDALLGALHRELPEARVGGVAAGLHLLLTLPTGPSDVDLAARQAERGVAVHPLGWHRQRPGPPGLVLGYAALSPDRLVSAASRIAAACRAAR